VPARSGACTGFEYMGDVHAPCGPGVLPSEAVLPGPSQ